MALKTVNEHIRDHLLYGINFKADWEIPKDLDKIKRLQWSEDFENKVRSLFNYIFNSNIKEDLDINLSYKHYQHMSNKYISINEDFIEKMKMRLVMGIFRYKPLLHQIKEGTSYNHFAEIPKRWNLFLKTGNAEHLIDVANFCLTTSLFMEGIIKKDIYELIQIKEEFDTPIYHKYNPFLNEIKLMNNIDYCVVDLIRNNSINVVNDVINDFKKTKEETYLVLIASMCIYIYINKMHDNFHFESSDNTDVHMS
jgi:hypothetical protein